MINLHLNEKYKQTIRAITFRIFKQFQSGEEFQQFMDALFKRDVKQLPEAEPHEHLGYEKHGSLLGENVRKSDISIPSIKRKEVAVEQPLSFRVSLV